MSKNINKSVTLTQEQLEFLRQWALGSGLPNDTDDSAIMRAAFRRAFGDSFPPDPPPHGGYRGRWPRGGETAMLKADWRKNKRQSYRAGTLCVVERNTRHGVLVSFGDVHSHKDALTGADLSQPGAWVNEHYSAYAFVPRAALVVSE